ncbi:hypothetical protein EMCRGX_G003825 [Ephydatia muelleri]
MVTWTNKLPCRRPQNSDTGTHEQHISDHSTDVGQIVDRANKAIAISHCQTTLTHCYHDAFSDLKLDWPSTSITPKPRAPSAHRRPRSSHPSSRIFQFTSDPAGVSVAISLLNNNFCKDPVGNVNNHAVYTQ